MSYVFHDCYQVYQYEERRLVSLSERGKIALTHNGWNFYMIDLKAEEVVELPDERMISKKTDGICVVKVRAR